MKFAQLVRRARRETFDRVPSACRGVAAALIEGRRRRRLAQQHPAAVAGCLFCGWTDPNANRLLCENASFYARLDNFPATPGHAEIVPKRHVESFFDLMDHELVDAYALLNNARKVLESRFGPDGYTIGVNEGIAAGRTVHHLHIHLIPRTFGDVPDPRGGIRRGLPNGDPDLWVTSAPRPMNMVSAR